MKVNARISQWHEPDAPGHLPNLWRVSVATKAGEEHFAFIYGRPVHALFKELNGNGLKCIPC